MKLPTANLPLSSSLEEFDIWVTPTLGEITDTVKFKSELSQISNIFELLGDVTERFTKRESCHPDAIAQLLANILTGKTPRERQEILIPLVMTLFTVTGKSDNNFKCQFPIFLRDQFRWSQFPRICLRKGQATVVMSPLPRELDSKTYSTIIAQIEDKELEAALLKLLLAFLLKDEAAANQLWSIGYGYYALKAFHRSQDLLAPLIICKVRGSVTASGGHEPERILRSHLLDWGLQSGVDFNTEDVVIAPRLSANRKTRAFDFVLPFNTPGWPQQWNKRLFIQCQFYAGDSGSVSHKNVDQSDATIAATLAQVTDAAFLEYVDGAGYFASLNGDLRKLLHNEHTRSFFQIRSTAIRLRRELQLLGFITPLEIEHALLDTDNMETVHTKLKQAGYEVNEIQRAWQDTVERGFVISMTTEKFSIRDDRRAIVRRYLLMDIVAQYGSPVNPGDGGSFILIPGYGPFYGISLTALIDYAIAMAPLLAADIQSTKLFSEDIDWLSKQGFILLGR